MSDAVRAAIDAAYNKYFDAIAGGDAQACARLYAPNACLMAPGVDAFEGRHAIANAYEQWIRGGLREELHSTSELDVIGDTAIEVLAWIAKGESGAELDRGRCIVVWKKKEEEEAGEWLVHRCMTISTGQRS